MLYDAGTKGQEIARNYENSEEHNNWMLKLSTLQQLKKKNYIMEGLLSQVFSPFTLTLTDFCANEHGEKLTYKGFCFACIRLQECSSGILLIRSGFLRFLCLL